MARQICFTDLVKHYGETSIPVCKWDALLRLQVFMVVIVQTVVF
jgi:hypothetical protein